MTTKTVLSEPFSRERDANHPVRWSPADGDTPAYLTLKGAAERLARFFSSGGETPDQQILDVAFYENELRSGRPLRTPFAFYAIDEAGR